MSLLLNCDTTITPRDASAQTPENIIVSFEASTSDSDSPLVLSTPFPGMSSCVSGGIKFSHGQFVDYPSVKTQYSIPFGGVTFSLSSSLPIVDSTNVVGPWFSYQSYIFQFANTPEIGGTYTEAGHSCNIYSQRI